MGIKSARALKNQPDIKILPANIERKHSYPKCFVIDADEELSASKAIKTYHIGRIKYYMADVEAIANLFLHLAERQAVDETGDLMTDLKLQKMLYLSQCWHLARYDRPLFQNKIEAWDHGPVVPDVYAKYRKYKNSPIHATQVDYDAFTDSELETIMDVFAYYSRYSASGLREISHRYDSPWANVYKPGIKHLEITIESMKDYYKRQPSLETMIDRVLRTAKEKGVEIIEPVISSSGNPVLPADDYEDWGDWDDD